MSVVTAHVFRTHPAASTVYTLSPPRGHGTLRDAAPHAAHLEPSHEDGLALVVGGCGLLLQLLKI